MAGSKPNAMKVAVISIVPRSKKFFRPNCDKYLPMIGDAMIKATEYTENTKPIVC